MDMRPYDTCDEGHHGNAAVPLVGLACVLCARYP